MSSLLVEVCKIKSIEVHPNADRLEIATVKGWNVIIQKGQYKIGDRVVFIPPDSIMPQHLIEEFDLSYMKKGEKVRTVKLRGVISQGLVLPALKTWPVGKEVSAIMGITKWMPPEPKYNPGTPQTSKKKINPLLDKYTDIENIKNYDDIFEVGEFIVITEKLHGCNARYGNLEIQVLPDAPILDRIKAWYKKKILKQTHEFVYGSHNVQITSNNKRNSFYGTDVWGDIAERYDFALILPKNYIFYGEIVGKGIQDLEYGLSGHEFYVFDIKDTETGKYLNWYEVELFCNYYKLKFVPLMYDGEYLHDTVSHFTSGPSGVFSKQIREGIVIRSRLEEDNRKIGRKILKSISPGYLLRKNATEFK